MRYRISQIKLSPENIGDRKAIEKALRRRVFKKLKKDGRPVAPFEIENIEIVKESIDARRKPEVKVVYTVDFDGPEGMPFDMAAGRKYDLDGRLRASGLDPGSLRHPSEEGERPVVAGFGPCGMFAALILARKGLRPIVIERGKAVEERMADVEAFWEDFRRLGRDAVPDPESNVQFGEGGAGTFSDGKLTTGIKDPRIRKVLEEFVNAGADERILYQQKPHIGTDRLCRIVRNIRAAIEELGGSIRFSSRLDGIYADGAAAGGSRMARQLRGILVTDVVSGRQSRIETDCLILATGHSARDTFAMLREEGIAMQPKPFSMGVRIEHPQELINRVQYGDGKLADYLGPADYKLNVRCGDGRGVYTFCMCPGGHVINASTEAGTLVTNGMSNSGREGQMANSALLVDVRIEDFATGEAEGDPLAGIEFQRKYEHAAWENMAVSNYGAFRSDREDPVRRSLPDFVVSAMLEAMPALGRKLKGFDRDDAVMKGVETRSSSPVRIIRDESMQSSLKGLLPAGEGPGYAGGIMSAAVDGIRAAEEVIKERCLKI